MYSYSDPLLSTVLETGETSIPRKGLGNSGALTTGNLYLTYFTAQKTEWINNLSIIASGTASGTSYCAMGVFDLMRSRTAYTNYPTYLGDPKLAYWTTSDTSIGSTLQRYTKPLNASWYKEKGMRYALGILWATTSSGTGVSVVCEGQLNSTVTGLYMTAQPILSHVVTGQTQLWPGGLLGGNRLASGGRNLPSSVTYSTNTNTTLTLSVPQNGGTNALWGFLPDEVGLPISGTNIPGGVYIAAWNSFTSITLSAATTATGSGFAGNTITIGPALFSATTRPIRVYFEMTS